MAFEQKKSRFQNKKLLLILFSFFFHQFVLRLVDNKKKLIAAVVEITMSLDRLWSHLFTYHTMLAMIAQPYGIRNAYFRLDASTRTRGWHWVLHRDLFLSHCLSNEGLPMGSVMFGNFYSRFSGFGQNLFPEKSRIYGSAGGFSSTLWILLVVFILLFAILFCNLYYASILFFIRIECRIECVPCAYTHTHIQKSIL